MAGSDDQRFCQEAQARARHEARLSVRGFSYCASRQLCRDHVHFVRELAQVFVIDHALEKFRILAPVFHFATKKKIVQADRCGAESVRLEQIRSGLEILGVNFLDYFRLG